jgi:hypothetical protein
LQGLDWKGDKLGGTFSGDASQGTRFAAAIEAFFGSTVPIASQVQAVGAKKGPLGQRLQRQFNPFYPIKNTAQDGSGTADPVGNEIQRALQPDLQGTDLNNEIQKALAP